MNHGHPQDPGDSYSFSPSSNQQKSYLGTWIALLLIPRHAVLLVKQNTSAGAVLKLLPLLHKYTVAPSSAQSAYSKEEEIRCLAPELLSSAVQYSHCSNSLAKQYGWLPKSDPVAVRKHTSLQCLSCVQKNKTGIYHTEQKKLLMPSKAWFLQLHWLAGKSTNIIT